MTENSEEIKLKALLNHFHSKLEQLNQYGMEFITKISKLGSLNTEDVPIILSIRHEMELIDAIGVLIKNNLADPCLLLVRGLFESILQVMYILDNDSEKRGKAFMYFDLLKNIEWHEKLDKSTNKSKEFFAKIEKDKLLRKTVLNTPPDLDKRISLLRGQCKQSSFIETHREYEKQREKGKNIKHWYSIYNGPKNIEQLAQHLKYDGLYNIFYRQSSEAVHGISIVRNKIAAQNGKGFILSTRLPNNIEFIVSITISLWAMVMGEIIVKKYPKMQKEFMDFYIKEIRNIAIKVSNNKFIKIERPV
jgi:hypothetical protein